MRAALLCLLLSGCATPPVVYRPERVEVPVPVPCAVTLPPAPQLTPDAGDRARWLAGALLEREALRADSARVRAALAGCGAK